VSLQTSSVVDGNWWEKKGDELADVLGTVFRIVRDENQWRTDKDEFHWGLYEGNGLGGVTIRSRLNMTYASATLPDNVCKMAVDTLTAKVATIRPIPQVLTSRGNWKDQRRARKLRQFIEGEFFRQKLHEKIASRVIKDALVCRAGIVQVHVHNGKPKVERVHPWTLYFDDWDAELGEPNACFRLVTVDREKAIRQFGKTEELKDKIRNAGRLSTSVAHRALEEDRSSTITRVEILEAWYRCVDHDDDDEEHECVGCHVNIIDGALLEEEPWPYNFFPFAELSYDTPNTGKWGTGLVQMLEGYQCSIDEANVKHQDALTNSGKLVLLRDGSGVFESDMTNGMRIGHLRAGPYEPSVFDMDLVNEHIRMRAPELIERGLNAAGVSQMAAQSQKPAGVESGIALQTLDDVESQRHIVFGRRFESWCMDVARLLIECVKKIAKQGGEYATKVPMRGAYLDLKWSDVEVDGFQLEMQSVGQLYTSFAGRLEKLKTLFEMGAIDKSQFMRNMDAGDVQGDLDLETVDRMRADEMIEAMLDADAPSNDNGMTGGPDRNYLDPDEYLPLDWAKKRAHQRRNQAQMDGAPEYILGLLKRWIEDLDYIIDKQKATAATPDGGPVQVDPNAPPPPMPGGPMPPPGPGGMPILPPAITPQGDGLMMPPPGAPPIAA